MTAALRFDDLEFVVLWEQATGEPMPAPFVFTSKTEMYYDFLREKREVLEQLDARWTDPFDLLSNAMVEPDVRITVNGFDGRDRQRADGRVRMMGLRRGTYGYLIQQTPGETYLHSGGFTVTECDPIALADAIVSALPEAEPGSRGDVVLPDSAGPQNNDVEYSRSIVDDISVDSMDRRALSFLNAPMAYMGTIEIVQGYSKFGPRGITTRQLDWRDVQDDGRYVIGGEPPYVATPADAKRMVAAINGRVAAVIQAIREERAP
ncbi:ESX secretion-associated protein EspG [Nocardia sp. NBC_00511]|uniref:ESX secretion-associated protein EspG n=1 Tax=Nocardia sp. NBC_00511 TaxID=2903591 RepID=UPI0030E07810